MMMTLLTWTLNVSQLLLGLALLFAAIRLVRGPRAQDRVLGLDTLYVNAMLLIITQGIRTGSMVFFEVALGIALLGFVATVALARFLTRGEIIE